jgi:hypothetical protein
MDDRGNVILNRPMAVGRGAQAGPNSIAIGAGANAGGGITFARLASELAALHDAMQKDSIWSGRQETIAIEQAAVAARNHDEAGVIRYLKTAGQQALNFATGVGSSLVAALIARALGM